MTEEQPIGESEKTDQKSGGFRTFLARLKTPSRLKSSPSRSQEQSQQQQTETVEYDEQVFPNAFADIKEDYRRVGKDLEKIRYIEVFTLDPPPGTNTRVFKETKYELILPQNIVPKNNDELEEILVKEGKPLAGTINGKSEETQHYKSEFKQVTTQRLPSTQLPEGSRGVLTKSPDQEFPSCTFTLQTPKTAGPATLGK